MTKSSTDKQEKPSNIVPVFPAAAIKRAKAAKMSGHLLDAIQYIKSQVKNQ